LDFGERFGVVKLDSVGMEMMQLENECSVVGLYGEQAEIWLWICEK